MNMGMDEAICELFHIDYIIHIISMNMNMG